MTEQMSTSFPMIWERAAPPKDAVAETHQSIRTRCLGSASPAYGVALSRNQPSNTTDLERLRNALRDVQEVLLHISMETEDRTFGKPRYDLTMDDLHDRAVVALETVRGVLFANDSTE